MENLIYWPIIGLIGGIIATYIDHRKGCDLTVKGLIAGILLSAALGPIMLIVILCVQIPDVVLIKGRDEKG